MLKDSKGDKLPEIELTEEIVIQLKQVISQGIVKKLNAAKKLIEDDKEVSAGLYIYSLEEFGKMLLLDDSKLFKQSNTKIQVIESKETLNTKEQIITVTNRKKKKSIS